LAEILALVALTPAALEMAVAEAGGLQAGAAAVDITPRNFPPNPPSIVAGGFLENRADRVHDPLLVRAIVLDDGGAEGRAAVRLALVVVDSCMMPQTLIDEAKTQAAARCGIPTDRMMVSATHTHSAPAAMSCLGTRLDAPYAARLPGLIADAIVAATDRLEPASIGWGSIDDWHHTHNRRWIRRPETRVVDPFGNPTGMANMHPGHLSRDVIGPSGPVDPQLSVLSIRTAQGKPLAVFANYSQHYFGSPAISSDYFGPFCRIVASALGETGDGNGPFVCSLSQGTSGDLMWMDYGAEPRPIGIQEYAAAVAHSAVATLDKIAYRDDVSLAMTEKVLPLAYRVPDEARLAWARPIAAGITDDLPKNLPEVYAREAMILHDRQQTKVKLQAIRIGDVTITTLPNEVYALTGLKLRNRSPAALHFNIELANGAEGYIPPPEQHVLGGYTTWPARTAGLEVAAETKIVDTLTVALEEVTGKPRRSPGDAQYGPAAEAVLAANPVGYWRLDDEDGETGRNAVANGMPARLTPGFAWYLPGVGSGTGAGTGEVLVPSRFSKDDSTNESSGESRNVQVNRAAHLAGGELVLPDKPPQTDATVIAWLWLGERSGASDRQGTVCSGLSTEPLVARQDGVHALRFLFGDNTTVMPLRAEDWHQVAIVRRGDAVQVHIDGAATPSLIGRAETGEKPIVLGSGLQGKLDEVALFDRAIDAAEIAALWKASGIGEQRAAEEASRQHEAEERSRLANAPPFPTDHAAKIAALQPFMACSLAESPKDLAAQGNVRFDPMAYATFHGGRLAGRSSGLGTEWSVAFWFRCDVPNDSRLVTAYLFSRGPRGAAQASGDHLGVGGTATPNASGRLIVFNGNERDELLTGKTVLPPRSWNHVVMARSGRRMTVWLNGVAEPEIDGEITPTAADAREFFLGTRTDDFAPLHGHMAEVAIFDRAVNAVDAAALFAASGQASGKPRAAPPLQPAVPIAPRPPEATRTSIHVPPGFRVELVAAEPDVLDPVAFDWDRGGRLWVVEMADYPSGIDGNGQPGGRIRVLEDTDSDGRYETSRLFAEGLSFPNGILCWRDGVIVTAAPQILFLVDTDGDGRCETTDVLFDGFMEGNQQLRVNGLRWGLDNTVWCASGGHHPGHGTETVVTSRRSGKQYALGSHDFRFDPDSGELWLESGPSQFGRNRDAFGHWFGTQNANPLWHWVIADRYLARNPYVPAGPAIRHVVGPDSPVVHPASPPEKRFHSFEQAGRFTSACGSTIYGDTLLFPALASGAGMRLDAFTCEPFHNLVQHNLLVDDDASFSSSRPEGEGATDFFASDDRWCRPVMTRTGPDGNLWVADMYRAMIEHPDWLTPEGREELLPQYRLGDDKGRIWRVVRDGTPHRGFPAAVIAAKTPTEQVALLDSDNVWQRDLAQRLLVQEPDASRRQSAVEPLSRLATTSPRAETRVQALWTLDGLGSLDDALLVQALGDPHPRVREQAVRLAERRESTAVISRAIQLVSDPDAKVCLQLALSCGEWEAPEAGVALVDIATRFADDPFFWIAVMSSSIRHADAFSAGIAIAEPNVAAAFREPLLRQSLGRRDTQTLAALLAAALAASPADRIGALDRLLADMQRLGADPWAIAAESVASTKTPDAGVVSTPTLALVIAALDAELARCLSIATDEHASHQDRQAAATLLARTSRTRDRATEILAGWLVPQIDPAAQVAVLEAIIRSGSERVPATLAAAWPGLSPSLRTLVIDGWLTRGPWTADLLDRIESGLVLPGNLSLPQRDRLLRNADASLAGRAKNLLAAAATPTRRDVVDRYRASLDGSGDRESGRGVYLRVCANCHRRGDLGRNVGPNLATVLEHAPERLLTNILDPNADIQPGYQGYTCVLMTGEVVTGLLAAETGESVTITLADGTSRSIARNEIEELATGNRSFMPEGVEESVTVEQMRDLLAFLRGSL
jgi:putative membrane-bound dehydrogenase-like protein